MKNWKINASKKALFITDSFFNLVILLSALLVFAYGVYAILDTNVVVNNAMPSQYEEYKPKANEETSSFDELRKINPDVIGWLTIYGTGIDYPIVQAANNNKYLTTSSKGEYSLAGSLFLDYRNNSRFKDFNSVIYGHHMAYHGMFGDLSEFKDEDFFDKHLYGNMFYDGKNHGIEFFAFSEIDAYNTGLYNFEVNDATSKERYLSEIFKKSIYKRDIGIKNDDKLIILSTCTTDLTNGSHILACRITDKTFKNTFNDGDSISSIDSYFQANLDILSIWLVVLILAAIAIMRIRKKLKKNKKINAK